MDHYQIPHSAHWQPSLTEEGKIVEGIEDIHQAIQIILRTPKGSDPLRPDFAVDIYQYLDAPNHTRIIPYIVRESIEAIKKYEPRIIVEKVMPYPNGSQLIIHVTWKLMNHLNNIFFNTEVSI